MIGAIFFEGRGGGVKVEFDLRSDRKTVDLQQRSFYVIFLNDSRCSQFFVSVFVFGKAWGDGVLGM